MGTQAVEDGVKFTFVWNTVASALLYSIVFLQYLSLLC